MIDQQRQASPRNPGGRPCKDDRILAVLSSEEWAKATVVAERLGMSLGAAYVALWRAERRGLIEHKYHCGYRVRGAL